jgi:uncharacterized membrane protein YphA (DoxX/SURF4 family)
MNFSQLFSPITFAQILTSIFLAILFLQSGFDKVLNWADNLSWLKGYFSKTFLKDTVTLLLAVVTIVEVLAGLASLFGAVQIVLKGQTDFALYGAQLSAVSVVMLFCGQRIAKDYAGASGMTTYFVICVIAIILFSK